MNVGRGEFPDLSVIETLDDACGDILRAKWDRRLVSSLHVHPSVYRLVANAKQREMARGNVLILLGLELVSDDNVPADRPEIIYDSSADSTVPRRTTTGGNPC